MRQDAPGAHGGRGMGRTAVWGEAGPRKREGGRRGFGEFVCSWLVIRCTFGAAEIEELSKQPGPASFRTPARLDLPSLGRWLGLSPTTAPHRKGVRMSLRAQAARLRRHLR